MNNTLTRDKYSKTEEAISKISALGYKVEKIKESELHFFFKNKKIIYYPKKEWATGGSITDCRGIDKLLNQIGQSEKGMSVREVSRRLVEWIAEAREKEEATNDREVSLQLAASADAFQFVLDFIKGNH